VTGYQWKWGYDYVKGEGEGHHLRRHARHAARAIENKSRRAELPAESTTSLVVPVGKKVRMLTTRPT